MLKVSNHRYSGLELFALQQLSIMQHNLYNTGLVKTFRILVVRLYIYNFLFPDSSVSEVCLQGDRTSTSSVIHFLMKWKLASGKEGGKKAR